MGLPRNLRKAFTRQSYSYLHRGQPCFLMPFFEIPSGQTQTPFPLLDPRNRYSDGKSFRYICYALLDVDIGQRMYTISIYFSQLAIAVYPCEKGIFLNKILLNRLTYIEMNVLRNITWPLRKYGLVNAKKNRMETLLKFNYMEMSKHQIKSNQFKSKSFISKFNNI